MSDINETNVTETGFVILNKFRYASDIVIDKSKCGLTISPKRVNLVGDDVYSSDVVFIKPEAEEYNIEVYWKLISKNFKDEGTLILAVKPNIERSRVQKFVDDESLTGIEERECKDFIEIKKSD